MKKSTLLSLATMAAIAVTSAGTYAVWDTTTATSTGTLTVAKPKVVVTATNMGALTEGTDLLNGTDITYTGTAKFDVQGADTIDTISLTPEVKNGEALVTTGDIEVTIKKDGGSSLTENSGVFTDTPVEGDNSYTVEITVKNQALAGQALNVTLTGELTKTGA